MNKVKKGNTIRYTDKTGDSLTIIYDKNYVINFLMSTKNQQLNCERWEVPANEFVDAFKFECEKDWIKFNNENHKVLIFKPKKFLGTVMVFTQEEADDLYFSILDYMGKNEPQHPKPVFKAGKTDLSQNVQVKLDNIEMSVKVTPNYDPREVDIRDLGKIINEAIRKQLAELTITPKYK